MEVVRNVFGPVSSWNNRCVVVYDGNRCIAKHPEGTHVKLRDEAFPEKGGSVTVADSIKGTNTASFMR
jgi:hypothetical protein